MKKMKKSNKINKITITLLILLLAFGLAACSQGEENGKAFELEGKGVNDLVSLEIPEGYEEVDLTQNGTPGSEILSQSWENGDSSVRLAMLAYDGKGILGMDGNVEDYMTDLSPDAHFVSMNSPLTDAYVTFAGGTTEDGENIKDYALDATFGYDKYVLSLELENSHEQSLTEEQKETFYEILKSISAK